MSGRSSRRLLNKPSVSLEEVYVENEVEREGSEVEKCGEEAPILSRPTLAEVGAQQIPRHSLNSPET